MDLLKAAKDITEQFDIKKVPKNLVNFATDRSVTQGLLKQDWLMRSTKPNVKDMEIAE